MKAYDEGRPLEKQDLVEWAIPLLECEANLGMIMDPHLQHDDYPPKGVFKFAELVSNCLQPTEGNRPSMEKILQRSLVSLSDFMGESDTVTLMLYAHGRGGPAVVEDPSTKARTGLFELMSDHSRPPGLLRLNFLDLGPTFNWALDGAFYALAETHILPPWVNYDSYNFHNLSPILLVYKIAI
ncbi:hypothetical protein L2E82_38508 [Cichorium intybus]|uniref:Uncharacterized protein n=1 Tax=Cichorium intybus TaxID=13427 RepID=A0ACB9AGE5_CICIN|nr:hypothetical protein L2E82_38508 [Cichorium intybus]